MGLEIEIRSALEAAFAPERLEITNESQQHAGHSGDDGSGESHWRVAIVSKAFEGQSHVQKHRAIYASLGENIMGRIHALALDVRAPDAG